MRRNAASAGNWIGRCDVSEEAAHALAATNDFTNLPLQHLLRRELLELQVTDGGLDQYSFGDESDDLAPCHLRTLCFGAQLHEIEDVVQRGPFGIDEIHRYLRLVVDLQPQSLHKPETA